MLVFGPFQACSGALIQSKGDIILNFSSLNQNLPRLVGLMPNVPNIVGLDPIQLEISYMDFILNDENAFFDLMKIMHPLQEGRNVFVCTSGDTMNDFITTMNDLLPKVILNRYGYNSIQINVASDLDDFNPGDFHFTVPGILNMDVDWQRYTGIREQRRLANGGKPYVDL